MSNVTHYNSETVILYGNELLLNNSNKKYLMYYSLEVTCTTLRLKPFEQFAVCTESVLNRSLERFGSH